jgi:hypothetical protein
VDHDAKFEASILKTAEVTSFSNFPAILSAILDFFKLWSQNMKIHHICSHGMDHVAKYEGCVLKTVEVTTFQNFPAILSAILDF